MISRIFFLVFLVLLTSCSHEAKQKIGLAKVTPDEYMVVSNPPLYVPDEYFLKPPGSEVVASKVDDKRVVEIDSVDKIVLQKTAQYKADDNIRQNLERQPEPEEKSWYKRFFKPKDMKKDKNEVLDPHKEAEKLKENQSR